MNLAIFMKVAKFGLQPSFPYFTRLFGSKKGKVARLQWYLKTAFKVQIFNRSKQRKSQSKSLNGGSQSREPPLFCIKLKSKSAENPYGI